MQQTVTNLIQQLTRYYKTYKITINLVGAQSLAPLAIAVNGSQDMRNSY